MLKPKHARGQIKTTRVQSLLVQSERLEGTELVGQFAKRIMVGALFLMNERRQVAAESPL
jgi:hypothetical protein